VRRITLDIARCFAARALSFVRHTSPSDPPDGTLRTTIYVTLSTGVATPAVGSTDQSTIHRTSFHVDCSRCLLSRISSREHTSTLDTTGRWRKVRQACRRGTPLLPSALADLRNDDYVALSTGNAYAGSRINRPQHVSSGPPSVRLART
jgi:hypothetical protein